MKFVFAIFGLLSISQAIWSQQTFHRLYDTGENDHARSVIETSSGDYIILGTSVNPVSLDYDGLIIKTNSDGDTIWCHRYSGTSSDGLNCGVEAPNGDLLVAGHSNSFGAGGWSDMWVMRLNSLGDTIWTKMYRGLETEQVSEVLNIATGGFLILGFTFSSSHYKDYSLIRIDDSGDTLWTRNYGMVNAVEDPYSLIQTSDGGFLITGCQAIYPLNSDVFLLKIDANGNMIWNKAYGGNENDLGFDAKETSDGGFIICGHYGYADYDFDYYLIRTNSFGDTLWTKTYDSCPYGDWSRNVEITNDGGYMIMGYPESFGPVENGITLFKTDDTGQIIWSRAYVPEEGAFNSLEMTKTSADAYIFMATTYNVLSANYDFLLTKTNQAGITGFCMDSSITLTATSCPATVSSNVLAVFSNWQIFPTTTVKGNVAVQDSILCLSNSGINEENLPDKKVLLYPNPVSDWLNIAYDIPHIDHLFIYDSRGNLLKDIHNHNSQDQIDFQSFPTGLYFIQIESPSNIQWQKVVKQ